MSLPQRPAFLAVTVTVFVLTVEVTGRSVAALMAVLIRAAMALAAVPEAMAMTTRWPAM